MKFFGKKLMLVFLVSIGLVSDLRSVDPVCGIFGGLSNESDCEILYAVLGGSTALGLIGFALWKYFQSSSFNATDLYQAAVNAVKALPAGYTPDQAQQAVITATEQYLLQSQSTSKGSVTITSEQLTRYLNDNYPNPAGPDLLSKTLTQLQNLSNDFVINTPQTQIGTSTNWADYLPSSVIDIAPGVFFVANGIKVSTYADFYRQFYLKPSVPLQSTPDEVMDFITQWKNANNYTGYDANQRALTDIVASIEDFNSMTITQTPAPYILPQDNQITVPGSDIPTVEPIDPPYKDLIDYFNRNKIYTSQAAQDLFQIANSKGNDGLLPGVYTPSSSGPGKGGDVPPTNNDPGQPGNGDLGNFQEVFDSTVYYKAWQASGFASAGNLYGYIKNQGSNFSLRQFAQELVDLGKSIDSANDEQEMNYQGTIEQFKNLPEVGGKTPQEYLDSL